MYISSTWEANEGGLFKAGISYIAGPYLKKLLKMNVHIHF